VQGTAVCQPGHRGAGQEDQPAHDYDQPRAEAEAARD
jgi:hypothetical protein